MREHPKRLSNISDTEFAATVAQSRSVADVLKRLGFLGRGPSSIAATKRIRRLGLDTSHFRWKNPRLENPDPQQPVFNKVSFTRHINDYSDEELRDIVAHVRSWNALSRALGRRHRNSCGSSFRSGLLARFARAGISTEHFLYVGRPKKPGAYVKSEKIFRLDETGGMPKLRTQLLKRGLKQNRCEAEGCGIESWRGKPITMTVLFVNGNRKDKRLENLKLLCPNCFRQETLETQRERGRMSSAARTEKLELNNYRKLLEE